MASEISEAVKSAYVKLAEVTIAVTAIIDDVIGTESVANAEVWLLDRLLRRGPQRHRDLVAAGLPRTSLARALDRLEAGGLIVRRIDPDDARMVLVSLSAIGRGSLDRLDHTMEAWVMEWAPQYKEIAVQLGLDADPPPGATRTESAMEVFGEVGALATQMVAGYERIARFATIRDRMVVALLAVWGPTRPNRFADVLRMSSNGMSALLDRIERDGYIVRSHGEVAGDRRAVTVHLTPRGESVAEQLLANFAGHVIPMWTQMLRMLMPRAY